LSGTTPDSVTYPAQTYGLLPPYPPIEVSVLDNGADPTGNDDCYLAFLQTAEQLPDGGVFVLPPGQYKLSRGIPISSGTYVRGAGRNASRIIAADGFANPGDASYSFFYNENWAAADLASGDVDIHVSGVTFDYSQNLADNAFASLKFRYITRLRIEENYFYYGGNSIAVRGCEQSWVIGNNAFGFTNCAWDFWEGPGTTYVRDNYAETSATRQFLNFNPEFSPIASSPLDVIGRRLVVQGNVFRCTGDSSEPCQIEPLSNRDNGITDVVITGNQFHRAYLVHRGYVDRLVIAGNTFNDYPDPNTSVIIVNANNGYTPKAVVISGNVIWEPGTNSANLGVIRCEVDEAVVSGNVITGTTYTGEPFYSGSAQPNQYGNYFEKLGVTGRMRQGFVFSNPNDATDNLRACIGWEDLNGDPLRMFMAGDFFQFWSTDATGAPRQIWSLEADNSVQQFQFLVGVLVNDFFRKGTSTGLTATGTTQPGALALVQNFNEVTTAAAGTGVRLPPGTSVSVIGLEITVWNQGANTLNVYPPTSAQIDALGLNIADTIAAGACKTYVGMSSTQYRIKT
jgi:hypothetical protein